MAILDDLLNRWKEKTPEEKIDLTQPAPPVVSPVSKIINSDWQNTASGGKRTDGTPLVDGKNLQQSWENTVAANRSKLPVPYIDTTTGYGVSADGTSEEPVFHVTPEQAAQMREAAEAGESFVSIYNRILKRPEEIDPRIVENRRKLAVLGDVGATLAEIIGVAAGGNAAARKPSTAVNNAFLQNLLDRRDQMQMLYDQGLLKAAFQDKVGRDAAQAAEAQREYETQMDIFKRANEIADEKERQRFLEKIKQIEIDYKTDKDKRDRAMRLAIAESQNNTRLEIAHLKGQGKGGSGRLDDLFDENELLYFGNGDRAVIRKGEREGGLAGIYNAVIERFRDAKTPDGEPLISEVEVIKEDIRPGSSKWNDTIKKLQIFMNKSREIDQFVRDYMTQRKFTVYNNRDYPSQDETGDTSIWDSYDNFNDMGE